MGIGVAVTAELRHDFFHPGRVEERDVSRVELGGFNHFKRHRPLRRGTKNARAGEQKKRAASGSFVTQFLPLMITDV